MAWWKIIEKSKKLLLKRRKKGQRTGRFNEIRVGLDEYIKNNFEDESIDAEPIKEVSFKKVELSDLDVTDSAPDIQEEMAPSAPTIKWEQPPTAGNFSFGSAPMQIDSTACYSMPSAQYKPVEFDESHGSKLSERMNHLTDTFSEYLMYLIKERGMENSEVWRRAIVDKKIFSKIKNNAEYHPNKLTALCLCMGAMLNLDETKDLLARAGYALSPCDKTDIIFSYFIENEIYDMIELDIQLEEHGLPCIIE